VINSMRLSTPNAVSSRLRANSPAAIESVASTIIQTTVNHSTRTALRRGGRWPTSMLTRNLRDVLLGKAASVASVH
jgi:hypothetical protein